MRDLVHILQGEEMGEAVALLIKAILEKETPQKVSFSIRSK